MKVCVSWCFYEVLLTRNEYFSHPVLGRDVNVVVSAYLLFEARLASIRYQLYPRHPANCLIFSLEDNCCTRA